MVLLGGALVRHRPQLRAIWSDRRDALRLVLFSVGGLMTCQYTYLAAIRYSNSATATVLQYMGQALILLWVCLRARRLPTRREGVALVLALLGAFLLATHGRLDRGSRSRRQALFWGLCAAVALMLYTLLPGDLLRALSRECLHGLRDVHRRRGAARAHAGVADSGRAQRRGGARHAGDLRCRHGACIHALSAGRERRRRRARKPARLHRAGQRDAVRGALAAHELRVAGSSRLCCHSGDGGAHRAAERALGKSTEKAEN